MEDNKLDCGLDAAHCDVENCEFHSDVKDFWTIEEEPIQANGYQNVIFRARDDWGGGRTKFTWELDADNFGCWGIDFPNHFCGGVNDLENFILAMVEVRNKLVKQWEPQWCNWNGNEWTVQEEEEECECHHARVAHLDDKPCGGCDCEEYRRKKDRT